MEICLGRLNTLVDVFLKSRRFTAGSPPAGPRGCNKLMEMRALRLLDNHQVKVSAILNLLCAAALTIKLDS